MLDRSKYPLLPSLCLYPLQNGRMMLPATSSVKRTARDQSPTIISPVHSSRRFGLFFS
ncbi:hypothetical protein M408DRAFT_152991 [Serendipita vermifera MAFF 305830]|uniref:Uncharacterized protein n=1 Tax=Serendipita vermifera MAFF 305830 TaxID=933852 RepID=A0A0C3BMK0_SERVB|nr:hypothetical protein M408DRAFT_152991 [Serendipita vermifera MAFF 305830]